MGFQSGERGGAVGFQFLCYEASFFVYSLVAGFWFQKVSGVFFCPVLGFRSLFLVVLVFMRWSFLPGIVRLFLGCHGLAIFRVVGIYSSSSLLLAFGCTLYTLCVHWCAFLIALFNIFSHLPIKKKYLSYTLSINVVWWQHLEFFLNH